MPRYTRAREMSAEWVGTAMGRSPMGHLAAFRRYNMPVKDEVATIYLSEGEEGRVSVRGRGGPRIRSP